MISHRLVFQSGVETFFSGFTENNERTIFTDPSRLSFSVSQSGKTRRVSLFPRFLIAFFILSDFCVLNPLKSTQIHLLQQQKMKVNQKPQTKKPQQTGLVVSARRQEPNLWGFNKKIVSFIIFKTTRKQENPIKEGM
ncbi:MAG: hypothetical protein CM1200mP16_05110 [Nitrospina sp.]|nr:MAG: hypothetical protein CM1200mP16_05110 [Nitrospina sp.]